MELAAQLSVWRSCCCWGEERQTKASTTKDTKVHEGKKLKII